MYKIFAALYSLAVAPDEEGHTSHEEMNHSVGYGRWTKDIGKEAKR